VNRLAEPKGSNVDALHFGSYIHKVLEDAIEAETLEEMVEVSKRVKGNYSISESYQGKDLKCFTNFLKFNKGLGKTVGKELVYEVPIKDDITVNGIIDRVIQGENGGYLVIDYKTSKREKTRVDLFQDTQLKGYAYAISKLFKVPVSEVVVAHYYPLTNNFVYLTYTSNQISAYCKMIVDKIWMIRKTKAEDVRPSRNEFCNWCAYKVMCPEFQTAHECASRLEKEKARSKQLREARKDRK